MDTRASKARKFTETMEKWIEYLKNVKIGG